MIISFDDRFVQGRVVSANRVLDGFGRKGAVMVGEPLHDALDQLFCQHASFPLFCVVDLFVHLVVPVESQSPGMFVLVPK